MMKPLFEFMREIMFTILFLASLLFAYGGHNTNSPCDCLILISLNADLAFFSRYLCPTNNFMQIFYIELVL